MIRPLLESYSNTNRLIARALQSSTLTFIESLAHSVFSKSQVLMWSCKLVSWNAPGLTSICGHSLLSPCYFQKMSSGQKTSWTETGENEGKVESATASASVCPTGTFIQSKLLFCFLLPNLSCLALRTSINYRVLRNVVESYSNSLQRNTTTEISTPNISLLFIPGYISMTEI